MEDLGGGGYMLLWGTEGRSEMATWGNQANFIVTKPKSCGSPPPFRTGVRRGKGTQQHPCNNICTTVRSLRFSLRWRNQKTNMLIFQVFHLSLNIFGRKCYFVLSPETGVIATLRLKT